MSELLRHRFATELEVRSGGDGRTVMGLCCPFDQPTEINEWGLRYTEQFTRGAFATTIATRSDRVKFLAQHDRSTFPLGRATVLREDSAGLYGEFLISKTERGDEALELIRDGALDGLSIGFAPVRSTPNAPRNGDLVLRQEVRLSEVSAVSFPAYDGARVVGVRSHEDAVVALERLLTEPTDKIDVARVERLLGLMHLLRAGKTLSSGSMTELQAILDLIARADEAVDEAQPRLAALMGVPNPDADDAGEPDADDAGDRAEAVTPDEVRADEGLEPGAEIEREEVPAATGHPYDLALRMARRHRVTV